MSCRLWKKNSLRGWWHSDCSPMELREYCCFPEHSSHPISSTCPPPSEASQWIKSHSVKTIFLFQCSLLTGSTPYRSILELKFEWLLRVLLAAGHPTYKSLKYMCYYGKNTFILMGKVACLYQPVQLGSPCKKKTICLPPSRKFKFQGTTVCMYVYQRYYGYSRSLVEVISYITTIKQHTKTALFLLK